MSYYQLDRQKVLQKAKERYSKEKAAECYLKNKEVIREKERQRYKNLSQEEKYKIKGYQKKRHQEEKDKIKEYQVLKKKIFFS